VSAAQGCCAARWEGASLRLDGRLQEAALSVIATPLGQPPAGAALPAPRRSLVLLALIEPARTSGPARTMETRLRRLHGLTAAEAAVAVLLARGEGLPAVGAALGIGHSTARTHLSRVFAKTGTSRQAELARLVEALSVLEDG
jgi:DNA-binding CsgD family transcriptional regulator